MFSFKILKKSTRSAARVGVIQTPHGDIETPAFVPVATRGSVRALTSATAEQLGSQLLIANTFHLHLTPGEHIVQEAGGLHSFMQWNKPLMTDSGGFQVLSFGFGREHSTGAMKERSGERSVNEHTPSGITITEDGVEFRSPRDGKKLFLGPRESIRIQEAIGADIIFAFDEATSPLTTREYMRVSLDRTHRWAQVCLTAHTRRDQALYGIVQGSEFDDLRAESARTIGALPFHGFGIGGEYGIDKEAMAKRLALTTTLLPEEKPRHVLGVGHPDDFAPVAQGGGDTFDCIAPTHYARHGSVFTSLGKLNMHNAAHVHAHIPIDSSCNCDVCTTYSRSYLAHLFRAHEPTAMVLATMHNVHYFNAHAHRIRDQITSGDL